MAEDVILDEIAKQMDGYSGADITNVCRLVLPQSAKRRSYVKRHLVNQTCELRIKRPQSVATKNCAKLVVFRVTNGFSCKCDWLTRRGAEMAQW